MITWPTLPVYKAPMPARRFAPGLGRRPDFVGHGVAPSGPPPMKSEGSPLRGPLPSSFAGNPPAKLEVPMSAEGAHLPLCPPVFAPRPQASGLSQGGHHDLGNSGTGCRLVALDLPCKATPWPPPISSEGSPLRGPPTGGPCSFAGNPPAKLEAHIIASRTAS